jgi:branched-chain amino acid transport system ATP-binding protein
MSSPACLLDVRGLSARYGEVVALHAANVELAEGELVAVLGPNGAGKSTLMRSIAGLTSAKGEVYFDGKLLPRQPAAIAARGIALVPEGRDVFGPMSVEENLQLGAYMIGGRGEIYERRLARVLDLFPRLKERLSQTAGSMSGGEQQMLAVGRALMADPRVLLLDEPSLGLAPKVTAEILETLARLNREGLSVLLVEQKAPLALKLANRLYVVSNGRVSPQIDPREIKSHGELARFYFQ